MSLLARLSLSLIAVSIVLFCLFGAAEYHTLTQSILAEMDETLALRARTVSAELRRRGGILDAESLQSLVLEDESLKVSSSPEIYVEVVTPKGNSVARSRNLGDGSLPLMTDFSVANFETVSMADGLRLRLFVEPVYDDAGVHFASVVVAESLVQLEAGLQHALGKTLLAGLGTLVVMIITVALVLVGGLNPLAKVSATANEIVRTGDVSQRVAVPASSDEAARVAEAVNKLLQRVESLLESQRRWLADTSHELRNPLTVIATDLDLLGRDIPEETRREVAEEAQLEVARLVRLVSDLKLLSWADTEPKLNRTQFDIRELLQRCLSRAVVGRRQVELADGSELLIHGDEDRLQQVFQNLLENAVRHTPEDGRIQLSISTRPGMVSVAVSDDGCGIADEHQPRVFERFYRVDPARSRNSGGTGLGLAICRALVQLHGGSLSLESEPGKGSTFTVDLPR